MPDIVQRPPSAVSGASHDLRVPSSKCIGVTPSRSGSSQAPWDSLLYLLSSTAYSLITSEIPESEPALRSLPGIRSSLPLARGSLRARTTCIPDDPTEREKPPFDGFGRKGDRYLLVGLDVFFLSSSFQEIDGIGSHFISALCGLTLL